MDKNRGFDINALRQQFEDLLDDIISPSGSRRPGPGKPDQPQHLPVNITETPDAYLVTAPLAGYNSDEIEISVRGQSLSIRAQRKSPPDREGHIRFEWGFAPAQRNVELPGLLDADSAQASFRAGVVTVTIPKGDKPQDIPVEDAAEPVARQEETPVAQAPEPEPEVTDAVAEGEADEAASGSFYMRSGRGRQRGRGRDRKRDRTEAPVAASTDEAEPAAEAVAEVSAEEVPVVEIEGAQEAGKAPTSEERYPIEVVFDAPSSAEQTADEAVDAESAVPHTTMSGSEPDAFVPEGSTSVEEADGIPSDEETEQPKD